MGTAMYTRVTSCCVAILAFLVLSVALPQDADAACCTGRECTDDNVVVCFLKGGNWTPVPCVPLLTCALTGAQGACCSFLGCYDSPETTCLGSFIGGVSCSKITSCRNLPPRGACCKPISGCSDTIQDGCTGFGEAFVEGNSCSDNVCGLGGAKGACCSPLGCLDVPSSACFIGSFKAGKSCSTANICSNAPPTGACCSNGQCDTTTESQCTMNGGIWSSVASCSTADLCKLPEPEGACCAPNGCINARKDDCLIGTFEVGKTCGGPGVCSVPEPLPEGACCVGSTCKVMTNAGCNISGGAYQGDAAQCLASTCQLPPTPGACCSAAGCQEGPESSCAVGTWHENRSCLEPGLCAAQPDVACCLPTGCAMRSEASCLLAGGVVSGTMCEATTCGAAPGACCTNGACTADDQSTCRGEFVENQTCGTTDCTGRGILGGCCAPNGTCHEGTRQDCDFIGGDWSASDCVSRRACDQPEPTGACCDNDACSVRAQSACAGDFHADEVCSASLCGNAQLTACCESATCSLKTKEDCAASGGVATEGADCSDLAAVCPAAELGACCANGRCEDVSRLGCLDAKGSFHVGATCADASLSCEDTVVGNCCAKQACTATTQSECLALAGTFLGTAACDGVSCAAAPVQGACCAADGRCSQSVESACDGAWTSSLECAMADCRVVDEDIIMGGGRLFGTCASSGSREGAAGLMLLLLGLVAVRRRHATAR